MNYSMWVTAMTAAVLAGVYSYADGGPAETATSSAQSATVLGLYGGTGAESYQQAVDLGFTYIFPAVAWYSDHDWMKGKVEQAHADGLKVSPSYGTAYDGYGDDHTEFAKQHPQWWELRRNGHKTNKDSHVGLSFGVPEVRQHKVAVFAKRIRDYDLDGITLDYTRMFDRTCGYHPSIVDAFKAETGRDPHKISNDDPQWVRFRAEYVTMFVRELREAADVIAAERGRPVELLACVNPDPKECLDRAKQDWQTWVDEGLVQGVVTMVYHHDPNETLENVRIANEACRGKVWHMPMIAPYDWFLTTDELLLDASLKCLKTGTGALAFYRDDYITKYEQWDAIAEVSRWTADDIAHTSVNYVRNPGFELAMENWADGGSAGVQRVEQADQVRTGESAVRFSGSGELRQIIEPGLPDQAASLTISFWAKADSPDQADGLFIDVSVNTGNVKRKESYFRVPVSLTGGGDWQQVEVNIPIDATVTLNHVQFGIVAERAFTDLLIDDIAVSLGDDPVALDSDYSVTARQASANWQPAADNILRGQAVIGSSFWEAGTEYDNAIDGDMSTENYGYGAVWVSQRPAENQWILISLPAAKPINKVRILNNASQSAYRTRTYQVELSADGKIFRKVAGGTLPDEGVTWTENTFSPLNAKYLRFTGVSGFNLEYAVGIQEIEAYGPAQR
jgi:hypothetical protein